MGIDSRPGTHGPSTGEPAVLKNATRGKKLALTILCALLAAGGGTFLAWELLLGPRATFRRLVIRPIPHSVRNIKVDRCQLSTRRERLYYRRENHAFVLRFDIDKEDFSQIVAARGFRLLSWRSVQCYEGTVVFGDRDGTRDLKLYKGTLDVDEGGNPIDVGLRRPGWFDLDTWEGRFGGYRAGKDLPNEGWLDLSVLFYNEQLGSAFLIKWEKTGY
jgi:hypothetical protein